MIAPLLAALIDDAALFPPGDAPLPDAVAAHYGHRQSWYADLVGPFVCPDTRLAELAAVTTEPLRVSVVWTRPDRPLPALPRLDVVAVEVRDAAEPSEVPTYGEAPAGGLDDLAAGGLRAKLRTGGDVVPTDAEVADFLLGCLDRKIPFKCTAGLHHAVRGEDHHGFLNILLAVDGALRGRSTAELLGVLGERDEGSVAHAVRGIVDPAEVRAWFTSFGSCRITEPVDDLVRLGLLVPGGAAS